MRCRSRLFALIVLLTLGSVSVAVALQNPAPPARPKVDVEAIAKAEPVASMTAAEFFKAVKADREAFQQKYAGKILEVKGEVNTFDADPTGSTLLYLSVPGERLGPAFVMAEPEPWAKVAPKQAVTIKGKVPGQLFQPGLTDCVLINPGPNRARTMPAKRLAGFYLGNFDAAAKKYKGEYVIVTGEVVEKSTDTTEAVTVVLKTSLKVGVRCSFSPEASKMAEPLKVGGEAKIFGQLLDPEGRSVVVGDCYTVTTE